MIFKQLTLFHKKHFMCFICKYLCFTNLTMHNLIAIARLTPYVYTICVIDIILIFLRKNCNILRSFADNHLARLLSDISGTILRTSHHKTKKKLIVSFKEEHLIEG